MERGEQRYSKGPSFVQRCSGRADAQESGERKRRVGSHGFGILGSGRNVRRNGQDVAEDHKSTGKGVHEGEIEIWQKSHQQALESPCWHGCTAEQHDLNGIGLYGVTSPRHRSSPINGVDQDDEHLRLLEPLEPATAGFDELLPIQPVHWWRKTPGSAPEKRQPKRASTSFYWIAG